MKPVASSRLSEGAGLLLQGIRNWMAVSARSRLPANGERPFVTLGEPSIYRWIAALVLLAARDADRLLVIHPPSWNELSADELALLRAVQVAGTSSDDVRLELRQLTDDGATSALLRCIEALASQFRLLGLTVEIAKTAIAESAGRPARA